MIANSESTKMFLLVQKRNSESLYDFPVCMFMKLKFRPAYFQDIVKNHFLPS